MKKLHSLRSFIKSLFLLVFLNKKFEFKYEFEIESILYNCLLYLIQNYLFFYFTII